MGKVLIALCTVFLLAFPARGEQAVTWESLTVWNDLPPLYDPAPWPSDLAGKRVILRWNGKHNGDLLLDYLHSICPNPRPRRGRSSNCAPIWSSRRPGTAGPVPHGSPSIRSSSNARASRP